MGDRIRKFFDEPTKRTIWHMLRNFAVAMVMLFLAFSLDVTAEFFEKSNRSAFLVFMTHIAEYSLMGLDLVVLIGFGCQTGFGLVGGFLDPSDLALRALVRAGLAVDRRERRRGRPRR